MAHYNICILVKKEGNESEDELLAKAVEVTNKFDTELEVPEHKRYLEEEEIKRMSKHYQTTNLGELAEKLEDWQGEKGFVEGEKIYALSTRNPEGHFDYGDILGVVPPEEREDAFLKGIETRVCNAVVTPDGTWMQGPSLYSYESPESKKILDDWLDTVRATFAENKEAVTYIADCHF